MPAIDSKASAREIAKRMVRLHRMWGWDAKAERRFGTRRIDILAISPGGRSVIAFEIKVSRADFLSEIRTPEKRMAVARYSTEFYFVAPPGLIDPREVPAGCGLVEVDGDRFRIALRTCKSGSIFEECPALHLFDDDDASPDELPAWMLPKFRRMPRFTASELSGVLALPIPTPAFNFDEVPF